MGALNEGCSAMVGLVIATHGHLAAELISTAEGIIGKIPGVAACHVEPGASPETLHAQLCDAVRAVDQGQGVLVLADLFGGSPCTQSLSLCAQRQLEVVTGVNLPMLLKANSLRTSTPSLAALAQELTSYAQRNITNASAMLRDAQRNAAH